MKEGEDGSSLMSLRENRRKKVLVAGPQFRGYVRAISSAFGLYEMESRFLEWREEEFNPIDGLKTELSDHYRRVSNERKDEMNAVDLCNAITSFAPDYVLVLKYARISKETQAFCSKTGTKLALWAYDSAYHVPLIREVANSYDLVYLYEPADLSLLKTHANSSFLPMAYDPSVYYPIPDTQRGSTGPDICFIGALTGYPMRYELLLSVSEKFKKRRVEVRTDTVHWFSPERLCDMIRLAGRHNLSITRMTTDHATANILYNASKICLNIHHQQSQKAVNPRTFEVLGSGGFLMTDRVLEGIEGLKNGTHYVYYSSQDEMFELLRYYLENHVERKEVSSSGHSVAASKHTYSSRIRTIASDFERISRDNI